MFKDSIQEYIKSKEVELFAAQVDKECIEEDFKKVFVSDQEKKASNDMLNRAKAKEIMCLRQLAKAKQILEAQNA